MSSRASVLTSGMGFSMNSDIGRRGPKIVRLALINSLSPWICLCIGTTLEVALIIRDGKSSNVLDSVGMRPPSSHLKLG